MKHPALHFVFLFNLLFCTVVAQQADSLKKELAAATSDSMRCILLSKMIEAEPNDEVWSVYNKELKKISEKNVSLFSRHDRRYAFYTRYYAEAFSNLGFIAYNLSQFSKAKAYMLKGLALQRDINDLDGVATTLCNIGAVYNSQGQLAEALRYNKEALVIQEKLQNFRGQASILTNMGAVYAQLGDIQTALDYMGQAMRLQEKFGDNWGMASSLNNMAVIHSEQGDRKRALELYQRALKLHEKIGDEGGQAMLFGKIGTIYVEMRDTVQGLIWLRKGLVIQERQGDATGIADLLLIIGGTYKERKPQEALRLFERALKLYEESGFRDGQADALIKIGSVYLQMNEPAKALQYAGKALSMSQEMAYPVNIKNAALVMKKAYLKLNRPQESLDMYELYVRTKDSLNSNERKKAVMQTELKYEFKKKEEELLKQEEERKLLAEAKETRQNYLIAFILFGLLLTSVFAIVIYKRLKISRQQKLMIEQQKDIVEEHRREILDSIRYAERIQRSFLATREVLQENLNASLSAEETKNSSNYFVFFRPKDVVSGDFYWAGKLNDGRFALLTADSTGHGVPGAIMSLLNTTSFEKAVEHHSRPSEILNATRKDIIERLKKDGSIEGGRDGMDCSVTVYDFKNKKLTVAAANLPVWIARKNELIEIHPDKMPVGKHDFQDTSFTEKEMDLQEGDVIYTLTDGFPDQFGGERNKKFKIKNLKRLLLASAHLPIPEQLEIYSNFFNYWKGELEQVDDVTLIGVRI